MTVYVHWYKNVLKGELQDSEYLGMRQVLIPLDGHHVIALFKPTHIYSTLAEANSALSCSPVKPQHTAQEPDAGELVTSCIADVKCKTFLTEHWDQEHNHLQVDALDTSYQIWRNEHSRYVVGVDLAVPGGDYCGHQEWPVPKVATVPQQPPFVHPSGIVAATPIHPTKPSNPIQLSLW